MCSIWKESLRDVGSVPQDEAGRILTGVFASLSAHKQLLLRACTFGTVHKKNLRCGNRRCLSVYHMICKQAFIGRGDSIAYIVCAEPFNLCHIPCEMFPPPRNNTYPLYIVIAMGEVLFTVTDVHTMIIMLLPVLYTCVYQNH